MINLIYIDLNFIITRFNLLLFDSFNLDNIFGRKIEYINKIFYPTYYL